MGWAIGYDDRWHRDIGYGVPAICDHPSCTTRIDRGLSAVCGGEAYGGDLGCGLHFCSEHLLYATPCNDDGKEIDEAESPQLCERCAEFYMSAYYDDESNLGAPRSFIPKPDTWEWISWKLTDSSWEEWLSLNPDFFLRHSG